MTRLTSEEWETLNRLLGVLDRTVRKSITDRDREIAKEILECKRHLGPLGMIETGVVLGRLLNKPAAPYSGGQDDILS